MTDSPLKLRVSWTGARTFGLDGSDENPSAWDALAGEDSHSDTDQPPRGRRAVPSWQQAASGAQSVSSVPVLDQARFPILRQGDEIFSVSLNLLQSASFH